MSNEDIYIKEEEQNGEKLCNVKEATNAATNFENEDCTETENIEVVEYSPLEQQNKKSFSTQLLSLLSKLDEK
jgi:hypothetical protein